MAARKEHNARLGRLQERRKHEAKSLNLKSAPVDTIRELPVSNGLLNCSGCVKFNGRQGRALRQIYAGILGPLAFATSLARGFAHGAAAEPALWSAWGCLVMFAGVGYVIGWIAERTVDQSVQERFKAEMAAVRAADAGVVPATPVRK